MTINVISISGSKGILLSKTLLEKYNIKDAVEMIFKRDHFIVKPKSFPRKGWGKKFKQMHKNGDDKLLIPDIFNH